MAKKKSKTKASKSTKSPARKKAAAKKVTRKKTASKKAAKKKVSKKKTAKKKAGAKVAKKTVKKKAAKKKTSKGATKKTAKKTTSKKKSVSKKAAPAKTTKASSEAAATATPAKRSLSIAISGNGSGTKKSSDRRKGEPLKRPSRPKYVPPHVAREMQEKDGPLTDAQLRKVKTGLTRQDLKKYKQMLLEHRAEILGDIESLKSETKSSHDSSNLSSMPVHMADIGSDNYEQERTLGLLESDRKLIQEINEALTRIEKKTYGVCLESGKPIGKQRLNAKPWARFTIEVVREKERRGEM